jgi:hypothetical protein
MPGQAVANADTNRVTSSATSSSWPSQIWPPLGYVTSRARGTAAAMPRAVDAVPKRSSSTETTSVGTLIRPKSTRVGLPASRASLSRPRRRARIGIRPSRIAWARRRSDGGT